MKTLNIHNKNICYDVRGKGEPVILLHGYLESHKVWGEFGHMLAKKYKIICPDLPGHGTSDTIASVHTIELLAETIESILIEESVNRCFLIGHSLGGYVALALAEKYPAKIKGLVLLHSHPFADSVQKKFDRDREASLIRHGRKNLLINLRIPESFAYDNHETYKSEIGRCISIAYRTSSEGMLATIKGLKIRPDRSTLLKNHKIPSLLILGKKDVIIDASVFSNKLDEFQDCHIEFLENSGHIGFIEEVENCLNLVEDFVRQNK